jgi:hypothetical protein
MLLRPTNIFIYNLARDDLKMKAIELFLNLISILPYWGRRKHFSSIRQILGSSTDRHNDLFGMAIFQFEREYNACLERRKQNEPQILNILAIVLYVL